MASKSGNVNRALIFTHRFLLVCECYLSAHVSWRQINRRGYFKENLGMAVFSSRIVNNNPWFDFLYGA